MLAKKIQVAYPVLLVMAGLLISFIPGLPKIDLNPELIFIIFLPPLLYEAAWALSFRDLLKWRRIILSFAFIVVFITAIAVAYSAYWFIPGFTLALGFLLGGILSPTDAVSTNAIGKFVKIPKRFVIILEGESLLNDASALIIMQFSVIAIVTGGFDVQQASLQFLWMVAGGTGCGLLIGWIFIKLHNWLPTDANIDVVLTLITPYLMYILAQQINSSGVLAVIAGGLLLSERRYEFLGSSSRVQSVNVWGSLIFLLNGIAFILIGLDLPQIIENLGDVNLAEAIGYGVLATLVVILTRIISCYGAVGVTLIMRNFITVADPNPPGIKGPFILGWAGMRGIISLAAALSIPLYLTNGDIFPQRNLILFITFVVILLTLIIQGLTLPYFIKKAKLEEVDYEPKDKVTEYLDTELHKISLEFLNSEFNENEQPGVNYQKIIAFLQDELNDEKEFRFNRNTTQVYRKLLEKQRLHLIQIGKSNPSIDEEIIRIKMMSIDYQEERLKLRS